MSKAPGAGSGLQGHAVFLAAFAAYAATAHPGLAGGDSGELTAAAYCLGIPHPTGYPIAMLLSRLWIWLFPVGEAAFRLNILSAVSAAGAGAVLFRIHRRLGRGALLSASLALLFAYAPAVWSQAVAAEVYALQLLLATLFLLALLKWSRGEGDAWLLAAALLAGAQLAHHLTSAFLVAAAVPVLLRGRPEMPWKTLAPRAVLLAALPLALYGLLLVRSLTDPPVDQGNPETLAALLRHVTGRQYGSRLLPVRWPEVTANAAFLLRSLRADLPLPLFVPALGGLVLAAARGGAFGVAAAALALLQGGFCLLYRVADLAAFTPPLLLALNLGLGEALSRLLAVGPLGEARASRAPGALLLAGALALGVANAPRMDPGPVFAAESRAADLLDAFPFGAQFLAEGDFTIHGLLHAQVVEQRRTDVAVFAQGGDLFQGYGGRRPGPSRLFASESYVEAGFPGTGASAHGDVLFLSPPGAAAGPDPGEVYRPLPGDGELRRLGERDAMAQTLLIARLKGRRDAARASGDAAAADRLSAEILEESLAYLGTIVPREDEFRSVVDQATRLGRWDLVVEWSERLAAVAGLDARLSNNLAWAYLQSGRRLDRAERLARDAVAAEPGDSRYRETLLAVLAAAGKPREAEQVMRGARP